MSGVGIDLLDVERFERALSRRPRLAERLFTRAERDYAATRARPAMHLAARFCAKEAVAKALGLTGWSFRDVRLCHRGAPGRLTGRRPPRRRLGVAPAFRFNHTARSARRRRALVSEDCSTALEPRDARRMAGPSRRRRASPIWERAGVGWPPTAR